MPEVAQPSPRPSSPRVLVLWADARSANLGVRVLAAGAGRLTALVLPGSDTDFQDYRRNSAGFAPTPSMIKWDVLRRRGPIKEWLRGFDLIVDTGAGDSFADIYGWRRALLMLYVQLAAHRVGVPVVLAPQTIGPFRRRWLRALAGAALRRATIVGTRDSASAAYARSFRRVRVVEGTDLVFLLPVPPPGPRTDVLLNVSGLLWNSDDHGPRERYRQAVRAVVRELEARGRTVTLLAHVLANASVDDDVPVVRDLARELGLQVIVPSDLQEVRSATAAAQLVIGARMHACLNALSTGTPAIAWAYSRKFAPLLDDLGWPHTVDLRTSGDIAGATLAIIDGRTAAAFRQEASGLIERTGSRGSAVVDAVHESLRRVLPAATSARTDP